MIVKHKKIIIEDNDTSKEDAFKNAIRDAMNALRSIDDELNAKYNPKVERKLKYIGNDAVTQFYDSYEPRIYDRSESLFKAYKPIVNEDEWALDVDASYIPSSYHGEKNDYIFQNSFLEGFHGGDRNGDNHPNPGEPWWKTPYPIFDHWYIPAAKGPAPMGIIEKEVAECINEMSDAFNKDKLKKFMPYIKAIKEARQNLNKNS